MEKRPISVCESCKDVLYDGDTAYKLDGAYYCPGCVTDSMVICRDDDYYEYPHEKSMREDD
ncbi:MAG: hypothetical protein E7628_03475 [Ruminococcaceae bacterium]|nr:hypothetical protein [Oscillospiraceae bacterium]